MPFVIHLLSSNRQVGTFAREPHLINRYYKLDQEAHTQNAAACKDHNCKRFVNLCEVPRGYISQNRRIWQDNYRAFEPDVFQMRTTKNSTGQEENECKPE